MEAKLVGYVREICLLCSNLICDLNGFGKIEMRNVCFSLKCVQDEYFGAFQELVGLFRNEISVRDIAKVTDAKPHHG